MASLVERITGSIVGLAVGDALGYPHEFRTVEQVRREIGPDGITEFLAMQDPRFTRPFIIGAPHPPGTFTDDTQMSLAVAESLISQGHSGREMLCEEMAKRFVAWCFSDENNRSPGEATCTACGRLRKGESWRSSGVEHSKGAGANMRVVPVGLFFDDLDEVAAVARDQASITHRHPAGLEGAAGVAIATAVFLRGGSVDDALREIRYRCRGQSPDFDEIDARFERARGRPHEEVMVDRNSSEVALGESWVAEEALFASLWCVDRSPASFREAVLLAVNTDGDSDTVACITGGFLGARLGVEAIPARWRGEVERSAELHEVGRRLAAAR